MELTLKDIEKVLREWDGRPFVYLSDSDIKSIMVELRKVVRSKRKILQSRTRGHGPRRP